MTEYLLSQQEAPDLEMSAIGLTDVRAEYLGGTERGGPVQARLLSLTLERVRHRPRAWRTAGVPGADQLSEAGSRCRCGTRS